MGETGDQDRSQRPTALETRARETDARLRSPSSGRNKGPIAEVLSRVLPRDARVLEIGCGTGEHAVAAVSARPDITWLPSDPDGEARASVAAWAAAEGLAQIAPPVAIDARAAAWGVEDAAPFDALVAINVIHIAPWATALGILDGAARLVRPGGVLFFYGPFQRDGAHTAPSNADFDRSLKARDPDWGVRDLAVVAREAGARGLALAETVEMPANNLSVVFVRGG